MTEEPGNDSGCTAVVALLRGMFQLHPSIRIHTSMYIMLCSLGDGQ